MIIGILTDIRWYLLELMTVNFGENHDEAAWLVKREIDLESLGSNPDHSTFVTLY